MILLANSAFVVKAEHVIRGYDVTGVQTCALPICSRSETEAYLRTVARNRLLMERRKHRNMLPVGDLEATESVWATFAGEDGLSDYLVALGECLEVAISPRDRQALELQYRDQASRAKIAAELELAVEGVKTLLRRARSALRDCVERKLGR